MTDRCLYWVSNLFGSYELISVILSFVKLTTLVMFLFEFSRRTRVSLNKLLNLKLVVNLNELSLVIAREYNSEYVLLISVCILIFKTFFKVVWFGGVCL